MARRTQWLGRLLLLALVVPFVGACDRGMTVDTGTPAATDRVGTVPPAVPFGVPSSDPRGIAGRPILVWSDICYGECAYEVRPGLPSAAVYDDGTVVSFTHANTWRDGSTVAASRVWTEQRTTVASGELAALLDLAARGGLTEGGVHANGSTRYTADGGGSIFVSHVGGVDTTIEAPFLSMNDDFVHDVSDPAARRALAELRARLSALTKGAPPVPVEQWALVARGMSIEPGAPAWNGPDLASLPDQLADGSQCAVLADADVDGLTIPDSWSYVLSGDRVWSVELVPLLPDQHTCADIGAAEADVHLDELARLRRGP